MKRKILKITLFTLIIGVIIALSFLTYKLTRPAIVGVVFNYPIDEAGVRKILDGYKIELATFKPTDGSPEIGTSIYTTDVGALLLIRKLVKQPQYKEGKIQVLDVSSPVVLKSPRMFYDRYYDNLIWNVINNILLK